MARQQILQSPPESGFSKRLWVFFAVFILAVNSTILPAQDGPAANAKVGVEIKEWRLGFDGRLKLGHWTEATCKFEIKESSQGKKSGTFKLRASAPDPMANVVRFESKPFTFNKPGPHHLSTLLQIGKPNATVTLTLLEQTTTDTFEEIGFATLNQSSDNLKPLKLGERLFVSLGECVASASFKKLMNDSSTLGNVQAIQILDAARFPETWRSYSSVDCVFLTDVSGLNDRQNAALQKWVLSGGRVVLSLGKDAQAFREHPMSSWFPITIGEDVALRELTGIESYVGRSDRIPMQNSVPSVFLPEDQGVALAKSLSGPLALRRSYGLGRVTIIGVNINDAPFVEDTEVEASDDEKRQWKSLPLLCWKLSEFGNTDTKSQNLDSAQLTQAGVGDVKTQLLAANSARFDIQRSSIWVSLGILIAYLVVVGPVDYLLVHKILRRPEWTWFSFPIWVVVACILLAVLSTAWNGKEMQISSTKIVDYDLETGLQYSRSYVSLYSPESRRYDVDFDADGNSDEIVCWTGEPETGVAGMYRSTGFSFGLANYALKENNSSKQVNGLPIPIWSSSHLATAGFTVPDNGKTESEIPFDAKLSATASGQLRGTIQHQFDGNLVNWLLAYGNRVYHPDPSSSVAQSIPPRQIRSLDNPLIRQRELKGYLTGSRAMSIKRETGVGEDVVILQDDYDPLNTDITVISRILTFYNRVGGRDYTRLANTELNKLDFSPTLDLNRAIFIAEIDSKNKSTIVVDGKDIETVDSNHIVRIVIPIDRKQQDIKVLPKFDNK